LLMRETCLFLEYFSWKLSREQLLQIFSYYLLGKGTPLSMGGARWRPTWAPPPTPAPHKIGAQMFVLPMRQDALAGN
jgi:hypothetical protein